MCFIRNYKKNQTNQFIFTIWHTRHKTQVEVNPMAEKWYEYRFVFKPITNQPLSRQIPPRIYVNFRFYRLPLSAPPTPPPVLGSLWFHHFQIKKKSNLKCFYCFRLGSATKIQLDRIYQSNRPKMEKRENTGKKGKNTKRRN